MIIINSPPFGCHKTLSEYGQFLIKRFLLPYINKGVKELHVVLDNPGMLPNTPNSKVQGGCSIG